jgi:tRNA threonylcarbamoyladenosine biosynthesis protein TsaE
MNCALRFETHSDEGTREAGRQIAAWLPLQGVVALVGELGAGKTILTQGIAEGRGAARAEYVSSPTFTLIHEYGEPVRLYHVDLYRLETAEQARRLGLEDLFDQPALVVIEWGDKFPELLPEDALRVTLESIGDEGRVIEVWAPAKKKG